MGLPFLPAILVTATMPSMAPTWASCGVPSDDVADGVDAGLGGLHPAVGLDEAAVGLDFRFLQADVFGARLAANRDEDLSLLRSSAALPPTLKLTVTPDLLFSILSTFAPVWKLMPRLR